MSSHQEDLSNSFMCLDVTCKEEFTIIVTTEEMFKHRSHKNLRCLKDIRSEIEKNATLVDKFLSGLDFTDQLTYIDEQKKNFPPQYHAEVQKQLDQIKIKLTQGYSKILRLQDVFRFIRSNKLTELKKLTGNFFFLQNIKELSNLSVDLSTPFQKAKMDILEYKEQIDFKFLTAQLIKRELKNIVKIQDKKDGQAENDFINDDFFKGQWKNNLRNAERKASYPNRSKQLSMNFVSSREGDLNWPSKQNNGDFFDGNWTNDLKINTVLLDGDSIRGNYVDLL